jgi:hypothetical protein
MSKPAIINATFAACERLNKFFIILFIFILV